MSTVITLARPYAKAAFDVANGRAALGPWAEALAFAASIASDHRVLELIGDPNVDNTTLGGLFCPDGAPEGFDHMISILVQNDRLPALPEIASLYVELKDEAERALHVTVRSATALDDDYQERLKAALGQRYGKSIEMRCVVDEHVIGGALIQAGDEVIDGSLRGKLSRMTQALTH
jgi:F-type H+-transporting ATPase subunit delta